MYLNFVLPLGMWEFNVGIQKPTGEKPAVNIPTDTNKETLTKQAVESYEAAIRFQKEGNWAAYGEAIKKLGLNGINVLVF